MRASPCLAVVHAAAQPHGGAPRVVGPMDGLGERICAAFAPLSDAFTAQCVPKPGRDDAGRRRGRFRHFLLEAGIIRLGVQRLCVQRCARAVTMVVRRAVRTSYLGSSTRGACAVSAITWTSFSSVTCRSPAP